MEEERLVLLKEHKESQEKLEKMIRDNQEMQNECNKLKGVVIHHQSESEQLK
jgi:hypothetical protein